MSHLDILSNLLSHIKNGQEGRALVIEFMNSRTVVAVLNILQESGYIRGYRFVPLKAELGGTRCARRIEILLRYLNEKPAIGLFKRVSKPSRRIYFDLDAISSFLHRPRMPKVVKGFRRTTAAPSHAGFMQGTLILSTPKGILSATSAKKLNVGGEVLARVCS
jgi:small subunit ribosomal protein S8